MRLTIQNDLAEMPSLHEAVVRFSQEHHLTDDITFTLDLCIEELITNIIKYAYENDSKHFIRIDLEKTGNEVLLQICDDGRPFDPTQLPEPDLDVPLESRTIGGLGIHLVRNYVTSMEYTRDGDQNITTLKKSL